jgi:hypothetical protein
MKDPINPSLITTPIGAVIGVALTRKLVPESDRTFNKYLIGGGLGAGAGLAAGELMKGRRQDFDSLGEYKSYVLANPSSEISEEEKDFASSLHPVLKGPDTPETRREARPRVGNLRLLAAQRLRGQLFEQAAKAEANPTKKAKLLELANRFRDNASSSEESDTWTRRISSVPIIGSWLASRK